MIYDYQNFRLCGIGSSLKHISDDINKHNEIIQQEINNGR